MERTELLEVQRILNYRFKKKFLLKIALTHSSSVTTARNYRRLAFIGDAALGVAFSNYVYKMYEKLHQGEMTLLRAANVSTEKLARVAIKHGLYRFLRHNVPSLDDTVKEFADAVSKEDGLVVYSGLVKAPKILADIVESIAGAIYVDVQLDLKKLWRIFGGLLEPIITWEELEQQPVTELYEMCQKQGNRVNILYCIEETKHTANLFVDGEFIASCSSDQYEKAKLKVVRVALSKLLQQTSTAETVDEDDGSSVIKGAKQKLHDLCAKQKWSKPNYTIETEEGPSHEKKYICSVKIERTVLLEVERILNYSFKKKSLLEEALTHSSFTTAPNYQRLEFIGDAALRLAFSNYVYKIYPKLDEGEMSRLRDANVRNEKLARVAIKHGLYRFLRRNDPSLDDKVRKFADAVSKEDGLVVCSGLVKAPKFLADIVESVAGAIYVDVDFDLQKLWLIFGGLLEPVTELYEMSVDEDNGSSEIKGAEQNLHELCCKKKWPKPLSMLLRSFLLIILLHLLLSLMITFPEPK